MRGHANSKYSGRGGSSYRGGSSSGDYYNESYYSSPSRGGYYGNSRGRGRGGHGSHSGGYYSGYSYESVDYNSTRNGIESSPVVPPKQERISAAPGSRESEYPPVRSDIHHRNSDESSWDRFSSSQSYQQGRGGLYSGSRQIRGSRGRGRGSFRGGYERVGSAGSYYSSPYDGSNRQHNQYPYHYEENSVYTEKVPVHIEDQQITEKPPATRAPANSQISDVTTEVEQLQTENESNKREQEIKKEAEFKEKHWIKRVKVSGDSKTSMVSLFDELDGVNSRLLELGSRGIQLESDVLKYNRILRTEEERVTLAEESLEAMEFDFQP